MTKHLLLALYVLFASFGNIYSHEMLNYEELAKLPVSELYQYGDKHMKLNHVDTAMGYYIILAGKYDTVWIKQTSIYAQWHAMQPD